MISNVAAGRTDVVALVYTAAYVPAPGESIFSVSEGWAPPAFLQPGHLLFVSPTAAIIDPAFFRDDFAQDLSPKKAAAMEEAQQAVALDILFTPSGSVAWQEGSVLVRRVGGRSDDRPGAPAVHGEPRGVDNRGVRRRQPRRRLYPLLRRGSRS